MSEPRQRIDSYDEVPYDGRAIPHTHCCHLAMVARLCGFVPASPRRCSVLELGCAVGTNLMPMAEALPDSRFVGVDSSAVQIRQAEAMAAEAAIGNVRFLHADILDLDEGLGRFDYIVCHGVYSWVAPQVRARILELGGRLLTPGGLMLVSYNTYPGWHLRNAVRQMMLWHVAGQASPRERIAQARGLLAFLAGSARPLRPSWGQLLREEQESIGAASDHNLFHEQLEQQNEPLYFHEFVAHAEANGLAYLADADVTTMFAQHFDEPAAQLLLQAPLVRREQYMDFLRGRMFRSSLLRRPQWQAAAAGGPPSLMPLHVRMAVPFEQTRGGDGATVWKHGARTMGGGARLDAPLGILRERWPAWVAVRELAAAAADPDRAAGAQAAPLLEDLFVAIAHGALEAAVEPPAVAAGPGSAPVCSPLARIQAARGEWVVSRQHQSVRLDPVSRFIVQRLDGATDRAGLAAMLGRAFVQGDLQPAAADGAVDRSSPGAHAAIVAQRLERLAGAALLLG